jgi:hypothetical protein
MAKRNNTKKAATMPSVASPAEKPKIHLAIMDDHWLDPVQDDIIARYERFQRKYKELDGYYAGGLVDFPGQYKYLGLNYSEDEQMHYKMFFISDSDNDKGTAEDRRNIPDRIMALELAHGLENAL